MAPALSAQQKAITAQFRDLTGASDKSAARYLKNANYRLGEAVDTFYGGSNAGSGAGTPSPADAELNKIFDSLRSTDDPADTLGTDSTMVYFDEKLGVNLENAEGFLAMYIVQAPAVGQISRQGFVEGWKAANAPLTINDQARYIKNQSKHLAVDLALFKSVYRHTFLAAKEPDLKAINLADALVYWETLFADPGWVWKSRNHDWFSLWKEYLAANWTRSVNKDMWNQTLEFATQSVRDESLSFWNEDGAWPSVIDDFVTWLKANEKVDLSGAMSTSS